MTAITLNGTPHAVPEDTTIVDLVAEAISRPLGPDGRPLDGGRLGMAVAVDAIVLPRSRWYRTPVVEGQSIEIITAVQGG
ncbi:thiamine biosynthesis protein ThiS [Citricoccus zhacaiensis]|uniref:Sulfur carrier protein n=4 Tax=Citricoccus TaxID=169133 RepID=A0A3D9LDR4_9MICC|nr:MULTISPECIES: sulfur carrier protein ThiS [Citricoccus]REE04282.1 sulfur carrier protein [Citricoccus muralis]GGO42023.1 thiamine biosynthesis protein ThiS [Citricoccus zhacaiensis]